MLLSMSIAGTIVIVFTVLVRSLFYHKLSKRIFQLLWGIAIATLLLPISFSFVNELFATRQAIDIGNQITKISNTVFTARDVPSTVNESSFSININSILLAYLLILISLVIYLTVKYVKGKRILDEALPLLENEILSSIKEKLNCNKVRLYVSDQIYSPVSYGVLKPKIVFPKNFDFSDENKTEIILLHELFHVKNSDLVKKYLSLIVLLVHFFNPFVWLMYILLNRDIESYCDERVLIYLGLEKKKEYALCLVDYIEQNTNRLIFTQYFAKSALEERITSIMKVSNKKKTVISFLLVAMGVLLFVTVKTVNLQAGEISKKSIKDNILDVREVVDKKETKFKELMTVEDIPEGEEDLYYVYTQEMLDEHFSGLDDSHLVLMDEGGGGYLSMMPGAPYDDTPSPRYEKDPVSGELREVINVFTDSRSETVAEAKKRLLGKVVKYS